MRRSAQLILNRSELGDQLVRQVGLAVFRGKRNDKKREKKRGEKRERKKERKKGGGCYSQVDCIQKKCEIIEYLDINKEKKSGKGEIKTGAS